MATPTDNPVEEINPFSVEDCVPTGSGLLLYCGLFVTSILATRGTDSERPSIFFSTLTYLRMSLCIFWCASRAMLMLYEMIAFEASSDKRQHVSVQRTSIVILLMVRVLALAIMLTCHRYWFVYTLTAQFAQLFLFISIVNCFLFFLSWLIACVQSTR